MTETEQRRHSRGGGPRPRAVAARLAPLVLACATAVGAASAGYGAAAAPAGEHGGHAAAPTPEAAGDHGGHGAAAPQAPSPGPAPERQAGPSVEHGGHDMRPVDVSRAPAAPPDARGGRPLAPEIDAKGVKVFRLSTGIVRWPILPEVIVGAYAYNGQVPGPLVRVTQGDRVRMIVKNELPEPTSVHWHGIRLPNDQDGAADVTQPPIAPGATYTYEFRVPDAGTYFYHTHMLADRQQALGLYGALVIDPKGRKPAYAKEAVLVLGEWTVRDGQTFPAMELAGMQPNYFTINGKSYPATEPLRVKLGERVRLRFVGAGQLVHPMHLHGGPFEIVETDGNPVPPGARWRKDTILVGPGERYDVEFVAERRGRWLLHCHINHHITNDGREERGGGGLTMIVEVS